MAKDIKEEKKSKQVKKESVEKKPVEKKQTKKVAQETAPIGKESQVEAEKQVSKKNKDVEKVIAEEGTTESKTKEPGQVAVKKQKIRRNVPLGTAFIHASFNNTIITITDKSGAVLCWSSAGAKGFKGARKGTPFAAQIAAEDAARKAVDRYGVRTVDVLVKGPGGGREASLRAFQAA